MGCASLITIAQVGTGCLPRPQQPWTGTVRRATAKGELIAPEWEYAAAGGAENRLYVWGNAKPDCTLTNFYNFDDSTWGTMCSGRSLESQ